jgi:hypothetical protein
LVGSAPGHTISGKTEMSVYQIQMSTRVARWFVFKPKIPIWVNFGGSCYGKSWYIIWQFGLFDGHLVYFVVIWYIFPRFGILGQ